MRYKFMLILLLCVLASSVMPPAHVNGNNAVSSRVQLLTKEAIIELAHKNYVEVQLAELRLDFSESQLSNAQTQYAITSEVSQSYSPSQLPTTKEELQKQIPNYDLLSGEEKAEADGMIMIQSLINHSFNQFIDSQNAQQFNAMISGKGANLLTLSDNIRVLASDKAIASLELEMTKKLVGFYATQQYYRLLNASNDLKSAEAEADYLDRRLLDSLLLYKNGVITETEMEKSKAAAQKQRSTSDHLVRQYELQLKKFKLELGINPAQQVAVAMMQLKLSEGFHVISSLKLEENIEMRKVDVAIKLAKENYDSVVSSNAALSSDYLKIWNDKKKERAVIEQQLEQKSVLLDQEGIALFMEAKQLDEERASVMRNIEDYKKLLRSGRVTVRGLEDLQLELAKLSLAADNANLNFGIFQEKQELAKKGIFLGE